MKSNIKMISAAALAVIALGGGVYAANVMAEGASQNVVKTEVDGSKPLDDLGNIQEKSIIDNSDQPIVLHDEDEKVGETVELKNLTRVDSLGNSNMEFSSFDEAEAWAKKKEEQGKIVSYSVLPILWSDNIAHSYTVDVELAR